MAENSFGAALANLSDLEGKTVTVVLSSGNTVNIKEFKVGQAKLAVFGIDTDTGKKVVINPDYITTVLYQSDEKIIAPGPSIQH